jgi:folate-dependent phosphoribosylglycinamide formyltransferase PurN
MRMMDAQLVHEARRKCTGGTIHAVDQILITLPILIKVHNSPRCTDKEAVGRRIDDLEQRLYALAHRR